MATRIEDITNYRPRVSRDRTVSTAKPAEYIEARTALNEGEILNVLMELHTAIRVYCQDGNAVKITGLGTFSPSITLDVKFSLALFRSIERLRSLSRVTSN